MLLFMAIQNNGPAKGLRIRFVGSPAMALAIRIERLSDGQIYDFAPGAMRFTPAPDQPYRPIVEASPGLYQTNLMAATTGAFPDGNYCITLHDTANQYLAIGISGATMTGGDDAPAFMAQPVTA